MRRRLPLPLLLAIAAATVVLLGVGAGPGPTALQTDFYWRGQSWLTLVNRLRWDEEQTETRYEAVHDVASLESQFREVLSVHWPQAIRERNYDGGSCVHASTVTQLRYLGLTDMATWWRSTYNRGEYSGRMDRRLASANLSFASLVDGGKTSEWFIDWCCGRYGGSRRGCCINMKGPHVVNIIGASPDWRQYYVVDNNHPQRVEVWDRDALIANHRRSGGWVFTILDGSPPPPIPKIPG